MAVLGWKPRLTADHLHFTALCPTCWGLQETTDLPHFTRLPENKTPNESPPPSTLSVRRPGRQPGERPSETPLCHSNSAELGSLV